MKKFFKVLAFGLVSSFAAGDVSVRADEVYTFVVKKQEEKAKIRWSLSEWLETRDKMRLMDLWLAMHSPSPYEFFVGGNWGFTESSGSRDGHVRLNAAAYASIFGLEFQKGFSPAAEWLGLFHLRVFGFHAQDTNITLEAGIRSEREPQSSRNALAGVDTTIYLARFFGIEGVYRHHFTSVPDVSGYQVSGNYYEGGAFIDFNFVRVYGNYFYQPETLENAGISSDVKKNGINAGVRLYF